jgi:hypothetical protein
MDFDEILDPIYDITSGVDQVSTQHEEEIVNTDLLRITFTDAKSLKRFFMYLEKMHSETVLEFYRNGILGKMIGMDKDKRKIRYVSHLQIPAKKLFNYDCYLEKLLDYNQEDDGNMFFSLSFKTSNIVEFLKSTSATSTFYFSYNMGDDYAKLTKAEGAVGGYDMAVKFSMIGTQFPIEGEICNEELLPIMNVTSEQFSSIAENLTKVKKQNIHSNYLDFQFNEKYHKAALYIHSSEGKFKEPFGCYDTELPEDVRFTLEYSVMNALASLPKVNDRGFMSLFFIDEFILRGSVYIGNFGNYHVYIV